MTFRNFLSHLTGRAGSAAQPFPAFVATIPRSGTWWYRYAFHTLHESVTTGAEPDVPLLYPRTTKAGNFDFSASLSITPFAVDHFSYALLDRISGANTTLWKDLGTRNAHLAEFRRNLVPGLEQYDLTRFPKAKAVFIYRNPFDHLISLIQQMAREEVHRARSWHITMIIDRLGLNADGYTDWKTAFPLSAFETSGMLDSYIDQMFSFHELQRQMPRRVLLVPFAAMEADPYAGFQRILAFLLGEEKANAIDPHIRRTVDLTSKKRMQEYEVRLGHSLSKPLEAPVETAMKTHIHTDPRTPWQERFDRQTIATVARRFTEAGLPFSLFEPDVAAALREAA